MIKNEEILVKCSKYVIYCDKCQKELAVEIRDDEGFTVMSKSHYDQRYYSFHPIRYYDEQFFPRQNKNYCAICFKEEQKKILDKLKIYIEEI